MEFVRQFQNSNLWKILLPLSLASDTLGLYDVIPEPIKMLMSIPVFNILLLTMFVVEAGADLNTAVGFFVVMCFFYGLQHGFEALIKPKSK